jgi:hypothetical protein
MQYKSDSDLVLQIQLISINPIRAGGGSYMTPPSVFLPSF